MKITDEMVQAFDDGAEAWPGMEPDWPGMEPDNMRAGLAAVVPLIVAEHERLLLEHAWDGRARGAILGAAAELRRANEPGAHRADEPK